MHDTARLLITCPDRSGIVAAVTGFLASIGANISQLDQHTTDASGGEFFMRVEFQTQGLQVHKDGLQRRFADEVAAPFSMQWSLRYSDVRPRMAILVSRWDHCLLDLLWRWRRGELDCDIACVISNHPDLREAVQGFGVTYHHVHVSPDTKTEAEAEILRLLKDTADVVVLARYMQILSPQFVDIWSTRIINIHHSFLPAFVGADPYRQAYERGVKIIGATAHYVTAELDAGPIIEQDTARVNHRLDVAALKRLGLELERRVLTRAVQWHLEDRVIIHGNKTVVFE